MSAKGHKRTLGHLFDHFVSSEKGMVGPSTQVLEIDCHLEPCWHLHWQLGGFFSFEDAVNVAGHAPARFARQFPDRPAVLTTSYPLTIHDNFLD